MISDSGLLFWPPCMSSEPDKMTGDLGQVERYWKHKVADMGVGDSA